MVIFHSYVSLPEGTLAALWNWMALASWHPTVFCTTLAVLRNVAESWEARILSRLYSTG